MRFALIDATKSEFPVHRPGGVLPVSQSGYFVLSLREFGTARTGAYFSTAPFIGAILAIALFGEPVSLPLLGAALLMMIGRLSAPDRDACA